MDALVARFLADQKGADQADIDALQEIAGQPLPPFYEWFLQTLGGSYGNDRQDMRAASILAEYQKGLIPRDERYLLIGIHPMPPMPSLMFYDLQAPCRDDAMVLNRPDRGPPWTKAYETLREKIAMNIIHRYVVNEAPVQVRGYLRDDHNETKTQFAPVVESLGFAAVVECGPYTSVYEREEDGAALISLEALEDADGSMQSFWLSGPDANSLRRVLGEITTQTSVEARIDAWVPPLSKP